MRTVLVTGGFDPLHSGHIRYLEEAKQLGDKLIVGLNSDNWLTRKKGRPFLDIEERVSILMAVKYVNTVIRFNDDDDTSIKAIEAVKKMNPNETIIFANGGDKNETNTPEFNILRNVDSGVHFVFGIGGNKQNSSSDLLRYWVNSELTINSEDC
tara:strand:+ start:204 stop:665 length:462 start_codon:yes stop_codon:yes gene_type:complete